MKKVLRGSGVAVVLLAVLYWGGVNALLASPWAEPLFNRRPELSQLHFSKAWTLIPGRLEVRDLRLSMQDRLVQIEITADRAHGNLYLWTLMKGRFVASQVEADGVTLHIRPRMTKGHPLEQYVDELPPIAGYETAVRDVSSNEVQQQDLHPLTLEFSALKVKHLRELWIDRMRYTGDAEVSGGMLYEPFLRLRIDDGHFTDQGGKLVAVAPNEVAIQSVDARVTLAETSLSSLDFASLGGLLADIKLSASADASFLNSYLSNVSGLSTLSVSGAPGQLEVALRVKHGVVADGALLTYRSSRVAVRLPLVEVWGAAAVDGATEDGRLALAVKISHAGLVQRDGVKLVDGGDFLLKANSSANLCLLADVDATLTLKGGEVRHLAAFDRFLPEGAGLQLVTGSGLMDAHLRLDSVPPRASGGFELTASDVSVKNRSATVTGKLLVHGELRSFDFASGAMDLSGSSVSLEGATLQAGRRSWPILWLRAVADPCLLTPNGQLLWSAGLVLGASNLEPLLAIVAANAPVPPALGLFADSPNVRVEATLMVRRDGMELPRFVLTSQNVRLEGALVLRQVSSEDPRLEPWGSVLVHAGVFSAGLELDGPKVAVVLGDLQRWSERRKLTPASVRRR